MGRAIGLGILVAAVVGGLVGLINAYLGGPTWLAGAVAGAAGAAACGAFASRGKK